MNSRLLFAAVVLSTVLSTAAYPLRVLAWNDQVAARKLAISYSKGTEEFDDLHPFQRSRVFEINSTKEAPAVIQDLDKKDDKGKPIGAPILIPEGIKKPLLILLPDAKAPCGLRLLTLEDDLVGFSWGSMRMINATGKKLVFKWEEKNISLPATWTPAQVLPSGDDRNIEVQLFLEDQPDTPVYSAVWEHRSHYRKLIFIMPNDDPRVGPIALKFITEDRRAVDAENAAAKAR